MYNRRYEYCHNLQFTRRDVVSICQMVLRQSSKTVSMDLLLAYLIVTLSKSPTKILERKLVCLFLCMINYQRACCAPVDKFDVRVNGRKVCEFLCDGG